MTSPARLYRMLVRLQPRRLRREFGDDMVALFEQQLRDEPPVRVWARAVVDLLVTVPSNHLEVHMNRNASPVVVALFAVLAIVAAVTGGPVGLGVGALAAGLAGLTWRRSRPVVGRTVWWKPAAAGAVLLATLAIVTSLTGELPDNTWFVAMGGFITAFGLLAAGLVLGLASLTARRPG